MSISCPMEDSRSSLVLVPIQRERLTSQKRIDANRRNALRSTGPKSLQGKARVARNAVKHGLCATHVCLPEECKATFETHQREIEEELHPRTTFQRILCSQIVNLSWQLRKLPEAQAKLFSLERVKAMRDDHEDPGTDEEPTIPPCEVLARRFSDEPASNAFVLLERYERGMSNRLTRLLNQYERLKKVRPHMTWSDEQIAESHESIKASRQRQREQDAAEWKRKQQEEKQDREMREAMDRRAEHQKREREEWERWEREREQTQSKPTENACGASETQKVDVSDDAPVTKQSQRDDAPLSPSPGTPGEGGGEGSAISNLRSQISNLRSQISDLRSQITDPGVPGEGARRRLRR